jgi:hypothetical protein
MYNLKYSNFATMAQQQKITTPHNAPSFGLIATVGLANL